ATDSRRTTVAATPVGASGPVRSTVTFATAVPEEVPALPVAIRVCTGGDSSRVTSSTHQVPVPASTVAITGAPPSMESWTAAVVGGPTVPQTSSVSRSPATLPSPGPTSPLAIGSTKAIARSSSRISHGALVPSGPGGSVARATNVLSPSTRVMVAKPVAAGVWTAGGGPASVSCSITSDVAPPAIARSGIWTPSASVPSMSASGPTVVPQIPAGLVAARATLGASVSTSIVAASLVVIPSGLVTALVQAN